MIETIFMLPFIISTIFLIYQAYVLINKVEITQKYLKGAVLGKLANRSIITTERQDAQGSGPGSIVSYPPTDGKYFMIYNEDNATGAANKFLKIGLDPITTDMLLYFCPSSQKAALAAYLKGQKSTQMLGACMGGGKIMGVQVSTTVFDMAEGETCLNK